MPPLPFCCRSKEGCLLAIEPSKHVSVVNSKKIVASNKKIPPPGATVSLCSKYPWHEAAPQDSLLPHVHCAEIVLARSDTKTNG